MVKLGNLYHAGERQFFTFKSNLSTTKSVRHYNTGGLLLYVKICEKQ